MIPLPLLLAAAVLAAAGVGAFLWRADRAAVRRHVQERRRARARGSHEPRLEHPWIDLSRCIGCASCVRVCPEGGVLDVIHGQAAVVHGSRCVGHGRCAEECPVGAIALTLGDRRARDDLPAITEQLEAVGRPHLWLAGEVTGYALVRTAVGHGVRAARAAAERAETLRAAREAPDAASDPDDDAFDLIVIGAGPAGLSASLEAKRLGLRFLTLERDTLGGTIARYPRQKLLMTRPLTLPLGARLAGRGYAKEELMALWRGLVREHALPVREGVRVRSVVEDGGVQQVETDQGCFRTRTVVLAIGRRGVPRTLGVPGEDRLKVAYALIDAQAHRDQDVLVVGGGDSAVEAALGLAEQPGNRVHLSYRRSDFFRLRARNELRIRDAIRAGRIEVLFDSEVEAIEAEHVRLRVAGEAEARVLPNDEVFLLLGGEPPVAMLEAAGVRCDPELHPEVPLPAEQGTGLRRALLVAAGAAVLLLAARLVWHDYYAATPLERRERAEHVWLHAAHGAGLLAGLTAVAMLMTNLAYLARRAPRLPLRFGSLRAWMSAHVATGLLALACASFHAGFRPLDTPGGRAWWGLLALVLTGALGRYLYSFVPRAANGRELALEEARQRLRASTRAWAEVHSDFAEQARAEITALLDRTRWTGGLPGSVLGLLRARRELARTLRRLRVRGIVAGLSPEELARVLEVARGAHRDALAAAHFGELRRLLAGWRYLHRWVALLVVGLVGLHVWAAWRYADLGGRG